MASKSVSKNNVKKCPSCGKALQFSVQIDFKTGARNDPELTLLNLTKINEETTLPLDVHVCPACGCVQLVAGTEIKNSLVRIAENRSPEKEKKG